jgi:hypothetical protein
MEADDQREWLNEVFQRASSNIELLRTPAPGEEVRCADLVPLQESMLPNLNMLLISILSQNLSTTYNASESGARFRIFVASLLFRRAFYGILNTCFGTDTAVSPRSLAELAVEVRNLLAILPNVSFPIIFSEQFVDLTDQQRRMGALQGMRDAYGRNQLAMMMGTLKEMSRLVVLYTHSPIITLYYEANKDTPGIPSLEKFRYEILDQITDPQVEILDLVLISLGSEPQQFPTFDQVMEYFDPVAQRFRTLTGQPVPRPRPPMVEHGVQTGVFLDDE